jgi:hypothetical protein
VKPGPVNIDRAVQQEQRPAPSGRPGELDENAVKRKVSETLARLTGSGKSRGSKMRKDKRDQRYQRFEEEQAAANWPEDIEGDRVRYRERTGQHDERAGHGHHQGLLQPGHDGEHQPTPRCRDPVGDRG